MVPGLWLRKKKKKNLVFSVVFPPPPPPPVSLLFFFFFVPGMGFSIVHWNIRGASANKAWLHHVIFSRTHIIALRETFLSPSIRFSLPGKIIYRQDRIGRRGGLLTAICANFPSVRLSPPTPPLGMEILGVKIQISPLQTLQIINIYAPIGSLDNSFLQSLVDFCQPPFVIIGDFNAHHSF